jgi:arylsulfatase A-like enzyme
LGKEQQQSHPFLYFEYPENGGWVAVRIGDWKGVKKNMRKDPTARWELYDVRTDPNEKTDLSAQHPDKIREMEAIVKREHTHPHVMDWEFVDPKVKK